MRSAKDGGRTQGELVKWGGNKGTFLAKGKGRLPGGSDTRAGLGQMEFDIRIRRERYPGRKKGMNQGPRAALPKRTFCDGDNF